MKYMIWVVLILASVPLLAAERRRDGTKSDDELIQGRWEYVSVRFDGQPFPLEKGDHIVISGRDWDIHRNKMIIKAQHTLDSTKNPKHLNLTVERDSKKLRLEEIYRLEGDRLTLCEPARPGVPRPGVFSAEMGQKQYLIVLKRGEQNEK